LHSSVETGPKVLANCILLQGVIITTYESLRINQGTLLPVPWQYVILDEGHKIRNPDAEITLVCKRFDSPHRLLISGAPVQNSLIELWSIFDFIFPGKLGTLPIFESQFSYPIRAGGYVNASSVQVQAAYRCAVALKDMISPYMLRRLKSDVEHFLPKKTEHVLMCSLTEEQRDMYMNFLRSDTMRVVMEKGGNWTFHAIDHLRKICNHPHLLRTDETGEDYGEVEMCGKLKVLDKLLRLWQS
jgi:DNA excision repair protein ERCC-6